MQCVSFFDYGNFKKKKTTMDVKFVLKGFLFKKSSDGNLHKFLPRTEAELVTMKNGNDAETEINNFNKTIGKLSGLTTSVKTSIVAAINDVWNTLEKRTNGKVRLYENDEGGNIEITSKSGYKWEMDAFDDNLRLYSNAYDGDKYCSYVFPLFEGTNKLAEYTQNIAKNNIITDVLSININGLFEQSYMFPGVIATEDASTLKNSPLKSDPFYAYREVFFIPNQGIVGNTYGKTIVRLTEAYPVPGRIWTNVYNTDFGTWTKWAVHEPVLI